jgi:pimeloyl-ACP methyl ester carboxylesterase
MTMVLKNWPVPYETLTVTTRHGDTHVISCGEKTGPPLVLLHGLASNAVSWVGDVEQYSRHFRVFAVDIPGEPGRSAPNRPSWEGPDFAEWTEDLLNGLGLEKASIVGLSQGGWTALKFATCRPIMTHFNARIGKDYLFSDDELARLVMPVMLLGGVEDVVHPVDVIVTRMRKFVPQLQAEIIPDMGHALVNLAGRIIPFLASPEKVKSC